MYDCGGERAVRAAALGFEVLHAAQLNLLLRWRARHSSLDTPIERERDQSDPDGSVQHRSSPSLKPAPMAMPTNLRFRVAATFLAVISLCFAPARAQSRLPDSAIIDSTYQGSSRESDSPSGALIRLRYGSGWVRVEAYELVDGTGEALRDLVQDDGKQSVGFDVTRSAGWKRASSLHTSAAGVGLEAFCAPTPWYRLIEHAKQLDISPRPGASAGESIWEVGGVRVIVNDSTGRISSAGWWDASGAPKRVFVYDDWGEVDGLALPRLIRVQEPDRLSTEPRVYERTYRITKASRIANPGTPPLFSFPPSVLVTDASTGVVSDSQGRPVGQLNEAASTGWSPSQQQLTLAVGCAGLGFFILAAYVYWKRRA